MYQAKAYSAASKTSPLASASIPRRDTTARDVQIEILFCGIYHSDLPGHEIVGRVTKDQLSSWQQTEHCNEAILSQLLSSF
jgi:alcohol dehydrogenase (NADP+)